MDKPMTLEEIDKEIQETKDALDVAEYESGGMYEALMDGYSFNKTSDEEAWRIQGEWEESAKGLSRKLAALQNTRKTILRNMSKGYRRTYSAIASQLGYKLAFGSNINDTVAVIGDNYKTGKINKEGIITFSNVDDNGDTNSIDLYGEDGILARVNPNLTILAKKDTEESKLVFIVRDESGDKAILVSIPHIAEEKSYISASVFINSNSSTPRRAIKTMLIYIEDGKSIADINKGESRGEIGYSVNNYTDSILDFLNGLDAVQESEYLKNGLDKISLAIRIQVASYLIEGIKNIIAAKNAEYENRQVQLTKLNAGSSQKKQAEAEMKKLHDTEISALQSKIRKLVSERDSEKSSKNGYGSKG